MPSWQPNWNDVRWDWGAADDAIGSLRRVADLLEELTAERERIAFEAQRKRRGRYREEFDDHLRDLIQRARSLTEEFRYDLSETQVIQDYTARMGFFSSLSYVYARQ